MKELKFMLTTLPLLQALVSCVVVGLTPNTVGVFQGAVDADDSVAVGTVMEEVQYTAAVLEYKPYSSWVSGGLAILQENARIYMDYATLAKQQGADIMVFPEYGLTSTDLSGDFVTLTQLVPDPADLSIPCLFTEDNNFTLVIRELSCGAAELGMYLVVDLAEQVPCTPPSGSSTHTKGRENEECPASGFFFYNSQVVFDRSGTVIARYRKKHLFLEPEFSYGREDNATAVFTTDFGVTFTLQVCFDIMYESPGLANVVGHDIRDVAMSTAWIDGLPYLSAPQIFSGWSAGLGVNLLVANYHEVPDGMLGSGIFRGVTGGTSQYIYDPEVGTTLIVGVLSTLVRTTSRSHHHLLQEPLDTHEASLEEARIRRRQNNHVESDEDDRVVDDSSEEENSVEDGEGNSVEDGEGNSVENEEETSVEDGEANSVEDGEGNSVENEEETSVEDGEGNSVNGEGNTAEDGEGNSVGKTDGPHRVDGSGMVFIHEDLERYNRSVLERSGRDILFLKTLCHLDSLCCSIAYTYPYNDTEEGLYMLLAYSGVVEKGGGVYSMFTQTCAVLFCWDEDVNSCVRVEDFTPQQTSFQPYELSGEFDTPFIYPSVFTQELELVSETSWTFQNTAMNDSLRFSSINVHDQVPNILALTLFGRWYERDPDV